MRLSLPDTVICSALTRRSAHTIFSKESGRREGPLTGRGPIQIMKIAPEGPFHGRKIIINSILFWGCNNLGQWNLPHTQLLVDYYLPNGGYCRVVNWWRSQIYCVNINLFMGLLHCCDMASSDY